jgi:hypothetical protein
MVEPLPAGALGAVEIPAGGSMASLSFDVEGERDVVAKELRVEGQTPEVGVTRGFTVRADMTRPPCVIRLLG